MASERPAPASGSAAASVVATAAALLQKVARRSVKQWSGAAAAYERAKAIRLRAEALVELDSSAFLDYLEAVRLGQGVEGARKRTIDIPTQIASAAEEAIDLGRALAGNGNPNLRADAIAAGILAQAAATIAEILVQVNESAGPPAAPGPAGDRGRAPGRSPGTDPPSRPRTVRGDLSKRVVRRPESSRSRSASSASQSTRRARRRGESR
ncbi:MAG: cyclodeaminase/cyclohydrolase family protein [Chloroflexi bacterium]|nr:MAG: cyclodeaminase/cyclohydrolase family protein [Chloroflexota bacterium]